jgi:hypothetical protein
MKPTGGKEYTGQLSGSQSQRQLAKIMNFAQYYGQLEI